ncbi:MAG: M48 family peptidase, partial [Bacteroidota bacterium]
MNPQTLLTILVAILCFNYALDKFLDFLNLRKLRPELPSQLSNFYDETEYKRSQEYLRVKMRFALLTSTISFVGTLVVLLTGFLGTLDTWLH